MTVTVIVADSSRARFFSAGPERGQLSEERDMVRPESRLREQDLVSDRPGGQTDSGGRGMHSVGHEKDSHRQQVERFARDLCGEVERLRQQGGMRRFYLVAAPAFLGLLRANLSKSCRELLAGEVDKNLCAHPVDDILAHLPKRL